ncbi:uncharacterized protein [Panulirus ornatus]|uniref:uncharacterized protein isoform X2 n=1 Tax=Panulirus ornatus TaxID=150431 RepID=UPI003A891E6F
MIDPQTWSSCSTVIQRAGRAKEDLVILQASAGTEMASNTVSNQRPDLHTHVMATTVGRETQHRLPVITCGSEQCSARLTLTPPLPQISRAVPSTSARTHLAPDLKMNSTDGFPASVVLRRAKHYSFKVLL